MLLSDIVPWMAIGVGASLAAMMWPAHRHRGGIVMSLAVGIGGALLVALVACVSHIVRDPASARGYIAAATGATVALFSMHMVVERRVRVRARHP